MYSNHCYRFQIKFFITHVEKFLQWWSQQIHYHHVILILRGWKINVWNALIFSFIFGKLVYHFGFIKKLWIFKCDILEFYCKFFTIFCANSLVYLSKGSWTKFFDDFVLFGYGCINHYWTAYYFLLGEFR